LLRDKVLYSEGGDIFKFLYRPCGIIYKVSTAVAGMHKPLHSSRVLYTAGDYIKLGQKKPVVYKRPDNNPFHLSRHEVKIIIRWHTV
jgi:hypothetical protein